MSPQFRYGCARAQLNSTRTLCTPLAAMVANCRLRSTAEEKSGYALFKSIGCVSCHQGVNVGANLYGRRGIFHPLGSVSPLILRVPSLRNVAAMAPYFHDGSAATLDEAVRKMALAQLDRTLSDQQIASIVAFLKTLTGTYRGAPVVAALP